MAAIHALPKVAFLQKVWQFFKKAGKRVSKFQLVYKECKYIYLLLNTSCTCVILYTKLQDRVLNRPVWDAVT